MEAAKLVGAAVEEAEFWEPEDPVKNIKYISI